ncbi:translocation/assembly module TamB domain-containing protein [Myroides pelagicus]|uniref:translocation/assembly module TamB domain-containing protein n=1 Tax=Myroides pelagicus TaxID=270914 RepID=UPI002DB5CACE|nr:translocation/assembly module TamB domain-containing protein [Myroides pelagicus]MEC4114078.1 translocation/assembly module TamB domain-containing protein [Myroides pelagicus]
MATLSLPIVQSGLASMATDKLNEKLGTKFDIERLYIDFLGRITIKGLSVRDNHDHPFIVIGDFKTRIADFNALKQGHIFVGDTTIDELYLNIHKYKDEELSNLDAFIAVFDNGEPGDGKFRLKSRKIYLSNAHFIVSDDNHPEPIAVDFKDLNGEVDQFFIKGPEIYGNIKKASFKDHWGLNVKRLTGDFSHTKTSIGMKELVLQTDQSLIEGDLLFTFQQGDMKYFVDKVDWDFKVKNASLNTSDINVFAPVFASNKHLYFAGDMRGVMNNFQLSNANLTDDNNSRVNGRFAFKNVFDKDKPFWMKAKVGRLYISRANLVGLMPSVLTDLLPPTLERFGMFDISGDIEQMKRMLKADVTAITGLGKAKAQLDIIDLDNPNIAAYKGNIVLDQFDLGTFLESKQFGLTSLDVYIDGKGFNKESINTSVKGDVFSFYFADYNYTRIAVDGKLKLPFYKGLVNVSDPNLQLDFNGKVDISSQVKSYDFVADIDYADLNALKFVNDSIAKYKGNFSFAAKGNTLENLEGEFKVNSATYQNSKDDYVFTAFALTSTFNQDGERSIKLSSKEALDGYVIGDYRIRDLKSLFTNALGSLYTNYKPYKIEEGQYLDFDITINNRLIEVFFPKLTVSERTHIEGVINNDNKEFKLRFDSPGISVEDFNFHNIMLYVNNNNPLYNTYVSIDSVRSNMYKIADFNLLNLTHNDTLFIRSEFKGGSDNLDEYKLNLYHTINKENLSVVGFKKSEVFFKKNLWNINEEEDKSNKIIFNKKLTDFTIDSLAMTHEGQRVALRGVMRDSTYKQLDLEFSKVDLSKITPDIANLSFEGKIDGDVHFSQEGELFHPEANIVIDSLGINTYPLGNMVFNVDGNHRLDNFKVSSSIVKEDKELFYLDGDIDLLNKQTHFNLESGFKDFDLKPIEPLLSSVASSLRGTASGKISILGTAKKPEVNGRLYLSESGFLSKFTGVDYNFEEHTPLDITENQFILRQARIIDVIHKTEGVVNGSVSHNMFKDWVLDLNLSSPNLFALNTKYAEGSIYYGTAFINGSAKLTGPVEMLNIKINATSNRGTTIKIPLKEAQGTGENNYIHFLTKKEKELRLKGKEGDLYKYRNSGIELDFEFVLNPEAEIEIILDRDSGHAMKGRGAGFITMEINTLGKFNMWGDFQAYEGEYNFRYGGLIDKKFVVKKYGTIRWDGDPMNAILDLQAIYQTEANPRVIVDNSIINRKVPTEVAIILNGSLSNPEVDFGINFPTVSSVVRSELDYKLNDRDTRERQAMALLATGAFFSSDNSSSSLAGSLFERASSIFDDIFSDEDDKFKVGLNYAQGERNPYTQTEGRLGVTFSTKVNDRISVNGKLGVPVGGEEQSVIVGDIEMLLRLNEDGTLNARFFNRENDINYLGEGIGYTQGVGLTYEVDFDTFKELIAKVLGQADKRAKQKAKSDENDTNRSEELPDSDFNRDFIRFYEQRNRSKSKSIQ